MPTDQKQVSPYVGPCPFERTVQDRARFFGRDRETQEIVSLIFSHPVVLVYAQSGAGKTSLFNARVAPELEEKGVEVLPLLRVRHAIPEGVELQDIANLYVFNALLNLEPEADPQALVDRSLAAFLAGRERATDARGKPVPQVIVFDQFEEILTLRPERWREQREAFFSQVAEALAADPLLRVVFVMREEYLAQLDPFARLLPEGLRTRFRLERLRKEAALAAVTGPLAGTERAFDEGVAEALVEELLKVRVQSVAGKTEVVAGEFVEPVQLQVVCQSLWQDLPPEVAVITEDHLQAFGDVNQALSAFYERSIEGAAQEAGIEAGDLRVWFERRLITPAGTRGMVYRGRAETGGVPNAAVDVLQRSHLIRGEWRAGARWYELTHDRFIEPIQASNRVWRELRERERERQRRTVLTALRTAVAALFVLAVILGIGFLVRGRRAEEEVAAAEQRAGTAVAVVAPLEAQQAATRGAQQAEATATQAARALLPIDKLRSMLTDSNPNERAAAAGALGEAAAARPEIAAEVVPLLTERLSAENEKEASVRRAAAQALGQIGPYIEDPEVSRQVDEALRTLLDDEDADVRQAADEALGRIVMPIDTFVGHWTNVDPDTGGITRIEVGRTGYSLSFHTFGKCHPTDCDWGAVTVGYTGAPVVVPYVSTFARKTLTVTLDPVPDELIVKSFTHFTDNSGREDYAADYRFARGEAEPTPTPVSAALVTPGDKLFVALFWERDGLAILDVGTNQVERTISFPSINARYVAANRLRQEVYVSLANGDAFYVIDARSGTVKGKVEEEVGWNAANPVVSPDGSTVYLASSGGPEKSMENKILVIDARHMVLEKVIRLGPYDFPDGLGRLEISPDGRELYTIDLTADELIVVDASTGRVETRLRAPGTRLLGISPDGGGLYVLGGAKVSKVKVGTWTQVWSVPVQGRVEEVAVWGGIVYVPDQGADQVILVEDGSGRVRTRWDVMGPVAVALSPDGTGVYVTSTEANQITVFDAERGEMVGQVDIARGSGPTDIVAMPGRFALR